MIPLPYETATAGVKALNEIQKILTNFGCEAVGTMTDNDRCCVVVAFKWRGQSVHLEANWNGYAAAWMKRNPYTYRNRGTRQQYTERVLAQARVSVCSVLRDWVKGQTTAVECGVMSFECAFMPHLILHDGRRMIDAAQSAKLLPAQVTV